MDSLNLHDIDQGPWGGESVIDGQLREMGSSSSSASWMEGIRSGSPGRLGVWHVHHNQGQEQEQREREEAAAFRLVTGPQQEQEAEEAEEEAAAALAAAPVVRVEARHVGDLEENDFDEDLKVRGMIGWARGTRCFDMKREGRL